MSGIRIGNRLTQFIHQHPQTNGGIRRVFISRESKGHRFFLLPFSYSGKTKNSNYHLARSPLHCILYTWLSLYRKTIHAISFSGYFFSNGKGNFFPMERRDMAAEDLIETVKVSCLCIRLDFIFKLISSLLE